MSDAPPTTAAPVVAAGSCRACSAPLAVDQRYCLNCGAHVAAPRVDLPSVVAGGAPLAGGPAGPAPGDRPGTRFGQLVDRVGGPVGAAAVVLVALGVGFLLGQGDGAGGGPATVIQRPPMINVQSGGTAGATSGTTSDGAAGSEPAARGRGGGGVSTEGVPQATDDNAGGDLDRLQDQPTEQATDGAPPRTDDKPSGGGTDAETIG